LLKDPKTLGKRTSLSFGYEGISWKVCHQKIRIFSKVECWGRVFQKEQREHFVK
jgi:hypothetical protein